MRGVWALGVLLACAWAADADAQVNARGEPEGCPIVRTSPDLDMSRRFVSKPVVLVPPAKWRPLIPGSQVYCEDHNAQDRFLGLIRTRTIIEHGTDKGVEFKIDYGAGEFYVARGKARDLEDATAFNADTTGPYWRGTCVLNGGEYSCTFASSEGVQFVYLEGLDPGVKLNFCTYSQPDFDPEDATLLAPGVQPVAVSKASACTTYDLGAPGRALLRAARTSGYMDVAVRGKNANDDTVEVKRHVLFTNAQAAYELARKVVDSQLKRAPGP